MPFPPQFYRNRTMKSRIASLYHVVPIAVLVIAVSACDSVTSSSSIDAASGINGQRLQSAEYHDGGNLDQQMADLVHVIPGFGGVYSNEDGSLTIYLKDAPNWE